MVRVDWSGGRGRLLPEGNHLCEVTGCKQKSSRGGDPMFSIMLASLEFEGYDACFDTIMLAGKGAGMGVAKLKALGFLPDRDEDINPATLVGRRVYVAVKHEEYEGQTSAKVDSRADGSKCGYWPEGEPPKKVLANNTAPIGDMPPPGDDDTPF